MCRECWAVKRNDNVCNKYLTLIHPPTMLWLVEYALCKINNRRSYCHLVCPLLSAICSLISQPGHRALRYVETLSAKSDGSSISQPGQRTLRCWFCQPRALRYVETLSAKSDGSSISQPGQRTLRCWFCQPSVHWSANQVTGHLDMFTETLSAKSDGSSISQPGQRTLRYVDSVSHLFIEQPTRSQGT
jgi:hypothetical protein